ncbi:MAG: sulfite exporter TauE/SafE family protein [Clostridiales bacterium]|nr:sulfite exporter TauE/SafE family protein [Clostridiales bacterium]
MEISRLMILAVIGSYFVKGVCGFANTILFTSIMSFQKSNINITPIDLLIGIPANFLVAYRERKVVHLRNWAPLAGLVFVGSVPGTFFLKFGNVAVIKIVLGVTIIGIGTEMLLREFHATPKQVLPKRILLLIGLVSGFISGLFGIGALLAAYMERTTDNNDSFKGNLCMVFLADNLFRLVVYIYLSIVTWNTVINACKLFPFMLLGLGAGMLAGKYLNEKKVKLCVIVMLMISGLSLILVNM